ncbi:carboxypeptidase regulatory-like domain-containing protein [Halorubrum halophilum]|uniref:carboxypeptidase regulatory-like domain-containing protein n=1 Tax=Halorubrum halophilum TaxID=413816 RepID=UPI000678E9CE|nr:carboxypeptidase regulatory-like domain-containing protein [Halorubrum halophilum]
MDLVTLTGGAPGPRRRLLVVGLLLCCAVGLAATAPSGAAQSGANGTIEGTVTNAAGEPIAGATVTVEGHSGLTDTTDESGAYEIDDLPYDEQGLEITHDKYEKLDTDVAVSTTNSPVTEDVTLTRKTGTLTGTIAGESGPMGGDPLPEVTVTVRHDNETDRKIMAATGADYWDVETNETGEYNMTQVPTGDVTVTATQDGFDPKEADVAVRNNETATRNIDLAPVLTTVNGTVTNTEGEPIAGATVSVDADTGIWPGIGQDDLTTETDEDGTYEILKVPSTTTGGQRDIVASADTFQTETMSQPISSEDGLTKNISLTHVDNDITGRVTGPHGNGLHNVSVRIEGSVDRSAPTGPDGRYRLSDVPFGTHTVVAEHADYETRSHSVEVGQTGEPATERDFDLTRATDVRLSVDDVWTDLGQATETVTVQYTFDEEVEDEVNVAVEGPSSTIDDRTVTVGHEPESSYTETFQLPARSEIDDGDYTAEVSALGENASSSFAVSNAFESGAVEFSQDRYQSPAGDFVVVDVTMDDSLDEAYLLVGGDRESGERSLQNHLDVLHVTGDASFVINTRLVGTDAPSEDVYIPVSDGEVTSYAHSIGAANDSDDEGVDPEGTFSDVTFQNHRGTEVADTLAEFRDEVGLTARGSPLQAGRYRLVAGATGTVMLRDDDVPGFRHPVDRSNLVLTQPELGEVNTYVLPPGPADRLDRFDEESGPMGLGDIGALRADATETDTIARGDRILVEVRGSGTFGALLAGDTEHPAINENADSGEGAPGNIDTEQFATLLERHEGVHAELTHQSLGAPNNPGSTLRFTDVASSDLYILPDDSAFQWENGDAVGDDPVVGGLYFVIDTRGSDPFDNQPRDGDELAFEMAYESPEDERYQFEDYSLADGEQPDPFNRTMEETDGLEHYPYFGDGDTTVRTNDSFVFEDPYVEYRQTGLDRELMVPSSQDGVIAGNTNIAPNSDVTVQLIASDRPEPTTITVEDVTIGEDGGFEVVHDFSELEPGERVEVEFYTPERLVGNRLLDKRGAIVVDDLDEPAYFEVSNLTAETTVAQGERLDSIAGEVTNTGEIADRQMVEFAIDGETVTEMSTTLDSTESTTLDLSDRFVVLPPGQYEYALRTDNDEETGQLTVTEGDGENVTMTDRDNGTAQTVSASPGDSDAADSEPDAGDDSNGGEDGPDGDDDAPATFLPFGIGTRETFGGTVLVGSTYLLGHWV